MVAVIFRSLLQIGMDALSLQYSGLIQTDSVQMTFDW
jgi:hypothetical protein